MISNTVNQDVTAQCVCVFVCVCVCVVKPGLIHVGEVRKLFLVEICFEIQHFLDGKEK